MLEGLPPNGASHVLRVVTNEMNARAIISVVVETFEPAETAASAFEEPGGANWATEVFFAKAPDEARIRALIEAATDAATVSAAQFSRIAPDDWVSASLAGLPPVRAGRFLIYGSHDRSLAAPNDIGLEIEAALAFGTGHHGTTLGCLLVLQKIARRRRPRRILDVGAGTGVLAIAAARLFKREAACGDIDPVAVAIARANARANLAGPFVRPVVAAGVRHPDLARGNYDLILANILAKPLRLLAPQLAAVAAPESELVLSGLLARDVAGVLTAYRAQGFALAQRRDIDGWATLLLRRGGAAVRPLSRV